MMSEVIIYAAIVRFVLAVVFVTFLTDIASAGLFSSTGAIYYVKLAISLAAYIYFWNMVRIARKHQTKLMADRVA